MANHGWQESGRNTGFYVRSGYCDGSHYRPIQQTDEDAHRFLARSAERLARHAIRVEDLKAGRVNTVSGGTNFSYMMGTEDEPSKIHTAVEAANQRLLSGEFPGLKVALSHHDEQIFSVHGRVKAVKRTVHYHCTVKESLKEPLKLLEEERGAYMCLIFEAFPTLLRLELEKEKAYRDALVTHIERVHTDLFRQRAENKGNAEE